MWWQVHKVRVASPGGTDWGELRQHEVQEVTYPRQSKPLQELAEQCKQSLRAMPQVAYANQLNEVDPAMPLGIQKEFPFPDALCPM